MSAEYVDQGEVFGPAASYDFSGFIGDRNKRRIAHLRDVSVDGGDGFIGIKLYDDETLPESEKRILWIPANEIVARPEVHGDHSFFDSQFVVHFDQQMISIDGKKRELTPKEFSLLGYLVVNKGMPRSREQILERVWGGRDYSYATVPVHIKRVRGKMGRFQRAVQTIKEVGYMFDEVEVPDRTAV